MITTEWLIIEYFELKSSIVNNLCGKGNYLVTEVGLLFVQGVK